MPACATHAHTARVPVRTQTALRAQSRVQAWRRMCSKAVRLERQSPSRISGLSSRAQRSHSGQIHSPGRTTTAAMTTLQHMHATPTCKRRMRLAGASSICLGRAVPRWQAFLFQEHLAYSSKRLLKAEHLVHVCSFLVTYHMCPSYRLNSRTASRLILWWLVHTSRATVSLQAAKAALRKGLADIC